VTLRPVQNIRAAPDVVGGRRAQGHLERSRGVTDRTHVLIAGVSARAAAASAARAGFAVTTVDAFADRDLPGGSRVVSPPRDIGQPFNARAAARAAADVACDAVVYLSNFENHPDAVQALAAGRALWGNPPDVVRRVRDPRLLMHVCRRRGILSPAVIVNANDRNEPSDPNDPNEANEWLIKPFASGGGHGVRIWLRSDRGLRIPEPGFYLQRRLEGIPGSVVFVAAGGRAVPLGVSRQLVGDPAFGANGFRYCGNILAASGDRQFPEEARVVCAACELATTVADAFGLIGVNGIDFMARDGTPYPIEVNPRWCGSMDLVERAYGVCVFDVHASACAAATLPRFDLAQARHVSGAAGKAIVFAREDIVVGDTDEWLSDDTVHDVPHAGERIAAARPVCTVYAAGADAAACYAALVARADRVYQELSAWRS
jgi:uncharacterized protein